MQDNFGKKIVKSGDKSGGKFKKVYYTVKCQMKNEVIDLKGDQKDQKAVMIVKADGSMTQSFTFVRQGHQFYIKNRKQPLYLTLDSDQNGACVYGAKKQKGNKRQLFKIQKQEDMDVIFIRTFCDKVLQIGQQGQGKKSHLVQWKFSGNQNQQFRLVEPNAYNSSTDEGQTLYETKQGLVELPQVAK